MLCWHCAAPPAIRRRRRGRRKLCSALLKCAAVPQSTLCKHPLILPDTFTVQTITLFSAQNSVFMIFINFKLTIYRRCILSSGNSHLLTAIRSMWFKVPWKDFQALTCSLLSVNILFQCPSLSCHICSCVYPLTFLLQGKVDFKHGWSDLLFPSAATGQDQKSLLSFRLTWKEKKEKASILILLLKGV